MIPPTAGEVCSPVATVTGSSSSPPPSLVRQSNGDIATNNNDKGKKAILICKILTHYPDIELSLLTGMRIFHREYMFPVLFLVSHSRRILQFEIDCSVSLQIINLTATHILFTYQHCLLFVASTVKWQQ
jgi:hypothetical protein